MTEEALREKLARAFAPYGNRKLISPPHTRDYVLADVALDALGIPLPVLAWIASHPEEAKGLASGSMVAVPKEPTPDMVIAGGIAWVEAGPAASTYVDNADA